MPLNSIPSGYQTGSPEAKSTESLSTQENKVAEKIKMIFGTAEDISDFLKKKVVILFHRMICTECMVLIAKLFTISQVRFSKIFYREI